MAITNLNELNERYRELFHLEDECVLPLLAATIINAKANLRHVWLYIIGASSSGKTSALNAFGKVKFLESISDFTENTLLSGAKASDGRETSLLKRLGSNFVIVMKDFTTILSKPVEAQDRLMSQLREVYDGYMRKETGTGLTIEWGKKDKTNRSVFIMAATEAIYKIQDRFSEMGSRGLNYVMPSADRIATTRTALARSSGFDAKMSLLQEEVAEYVNNTVRNLPAEFPPLSEEFLDEIIRTAEFVTRARSVVVRDYRGNLMLALSAEMPMRVATQLQSIAQILVHLNGGTEDDWIRKTIMKCAFDCIPKQSHLVLRYLAQYSKVQTNAIASIIGYPPERAKEWLENLQMHKIVDVQNVNFKYYWSMFPEDKKLVLEYLGLEQKFEDLDDVGGTTDDGFGSFSSPNDVTL